MGQADAAKYNADEATKKSADAVADAKTLESAMKDASSQLGILDTKRKELEDALVNLAVCTAPRVIPWGPGGSSNGVSYAKPLESLAGFTAHIVVVSDPESRRAAWNLETALHDAGLTVTVDPSGPREGLLDGVWVNWYSLASATNEDSAHAGSPSSIANHEAVPVSREAADRIVSFLGSYNWQARSVEGSVSMHDVTPKGLRIEVGLYPPTEVVTPPAMVGRAEALAKALENNEIARKADRRKRFEERIKDMSPAEAARETINEEKSIKMMEDADRQYKAEHARDNVQPCKPLDKQFSAALSR